MDRVISALDDKDLPTAIFMDLSKAFDTLDHTTLLHKMKYYGINGITLNWFNSYPSNGSQYVEIQNVQSTKNGHKYWCTTRLYIGTAIVPHICEWHT